MPWALDLRAPSANRRTGSADPVLCSLTQPQAQRADQVLRPHSLTGYPFPRCPVLLQTQSQSVPSPGRAPSCLIFSLGQVHVTLTKEVRVKASMRKPTGCELYFSQGLNWLLISFKCDKQETTLRQLWKLSLPSTIEFSCVTFKKKERKKNTQEKK